MNNLSTGRIAAGVVGLAVVGVIAAAVGGLFNNGFTDGGIDVRNTACEELAAARQAVGAEFEARKLAAQTELDADKEKASDEFWAENRRLEQAYHDCISAALTADPCKEPFEEVGRLYEEIMADFDAGKGFNEAKFNEREQAKKEYNDCVEQARKPEFYKDKEAQCDANLAAGKDANQQKRVAAEQASQIKYDAAVAAAASAQQQKLAILDAIEKKCNEPGGNSNVNVGAVNTGGTGTAVQPNSSACTGVFSGNDPDLRRRINDLENQLNKAKAGGLSGGLFGTDHLQQALDDLRQELKDSERTCETDADCGNPEPVCCSGTQVGRLFCDDGVCAAEQTDCVDPEICTGKPAQCVAPSTGVQQQDGVYITRTIPEVGACSQNLQVLSLQQSTPDSVRYSLGGNIPGWLHIDKPSGTLPGQMQVTYSCNTVQGFGPGVYTAGGSITVYNANNELINTIPFTVSITVEAVAAEETVRVIQYGGKYIPIDQIHAGTGSECNEEEHWHANGGSVTATDGTVLSDPAPGGCGFGKTRAVPVISVPAFKGKIEVRGLEGLR